MAVRQHEPVAVVPARRGRRETQVVVPEHFGDVGHAHRHAGMTRARGFDGVHRKHADRVREAAARRPAARRDRSLLMGVRRGHRVAMVSVPKRVLWKGSNTALFVRERYERCERYGRATRTARIERRLSPRPDASRNRRATAKSICEAMPNRLPIIGYHFAHLSIRASSVRMVKSPQGAPAQGLADQRYASARGGGQPHARRDDLRDVPRGARAREARPALGPRR